MRSSTGVKHSRRYPPAYHAELMADGWEAEDAWQGILAFFG
jgi:hypothetical protein